MVGWDWLGAPPGALGGCGIEAKKMELSDTRRERWPEGQGRAIKLGPSAARFPSHSFRIFLEPPTVSARVPQHWTNPLDLDTLTPMPCILY